MTAEVHAAAKRRAKELGMSSLAFYIEALIGQDTSEGFDLVVTYSASDEPRYRSTPFRGRLLKRKESRSRKRAQPVRRVAEEVVLPSGPLLR
tara:strand:- start:71 stop:346 length:276 start_codon:yes stop_codon:yes gene_type:complete